MHFPKVELKTLIMTKCQTIALLLTQMFLMSGCSPQQTEYENKKAVVARFGNAGSTTGYHNIRLMTIRDINGGGAGFAYGAVSGYPGASADIGGVGIPQHLEGYWVKYNHDENTRDKFFKISTPIDAQLAEQKIKTLQNYYQNFKTIHGIMQVVVDSERVRVFYTLGCHEPYDDCTPKEDVNHSSWVIRAPAGSEDVVLLFDGKGESSDTPFPGSPYEEK
ncbi:hypothetical protein L6J37_15965 [Photobacterium sp. WH77]|uniref:hypothetical protein n=1 Tax=unclassified Photobacterium TaxID=2628852 RepID=UPI001EDB60E0|nr:MULTISPECIES: hypothetical protein [unclassified Photobacterium]MCG2838330.1 hypothetical protein [Photobacterium sp. WH77]MCG2845955.1 hypothetical protein [Photobacterium sp. WH80]